MAKIINLQVRVQKPQGALISQKPWEFRRAHWKSSHFIQMSKARSAKLECNREYPHRKDGKSPMHLSPHFLLKGGMDSTVRAMYASRDDDGRMRDVYYLVGLMDCMINQVHPILRTDLLRAMYKRVFAMKKELNIHWHGPLDQILLPIDSQLYSNHEYLSLLTGADTMKELYQAIRRGTDKMFDILSCHYVFYCPNAGG